MTNDQIGALLMGAATLWFAFMIVRALRRKQDALEIDLFQVVLLASVWMAGRLVAGKSMLTLLFGGGA